MFQSSFELTGYITHHDAHTFAQLGFQSSFELTGYITAALAKNELGIKVVSKLFRAYRLYNNKDSFSEDIAKEGFKALSSLQVI